MMDNSNGVAEFASNEQDTDFTNGSSNARRKSTAGSMSKVIESLKSSEYQFSNKNNNNNSDLNNRPLGTPTVGLQSFIPEDDEIFPCENFAMVTPGIYRSAFPKKRNFSFLKRLGLKSILTLILEDYPEQNMKYMEENDIRLFQFGVPGNKEPFVDIPEDIIRGALSVILDKRNHPLLIHCNKGKHRTGCLVGCLRKLQHWSYSVIFDEYRKFSQPKSRSMDQQFIELFDITKIKFDPRYLPSWPEIKDSPTFMIKNTLKAFENKDQQDIQI